MNDDVIRLTYRELGERLGIKVHAARMKAKRAAARGEWHVIVGNHPSDPVHVDVPTSALPFPARASATVSAREGRSGPRVASATGNAALAAMIAQNAALIAHVATLDARLSDERERSRQDAADMAEARRQDALALASAEARASAALAEVARLTAAQRRRGGRYARGVPRP